MLNEISIKNLGVIEKATLEPSPGLTVITGETGTGKSMILNALNMLLGKRVNQSLIHSNATSAKVDGCWYIPENSIENIQNIVEDAGGELEANELIISRVILNDGKSKAVLGGSRVPAAKLSDIGVNLVNIHGQSDQVKLKNSTAQLKTVDRFIKKNEKENSQSKDGKTFDMLMEDYIQAYKEWKNTKEIIEDARKNSLSIKHEISFLTDFMKEYAAIDPEENEISKLESEVSVLANIEEINNYATTALAAVNAEDSEIPSIEDQINIAARNIESIAEFDKSEEISELLSIANNLRNNASELVSGLSTYVDSSDTDSIEELYSLQERLQEIQKFVKKHSSDTFSDINDEALINVIARVEEAEARLEELEIRNTPIDELEKDLENFFEEMKNAASLITEKRLEASNLLSSLVSSEIEQLSMAGTKFVIEVSSEYSDSDFTTQGVDSVSFNIMFPGSKVSVPISKSASGGELSRIMLALEVVIADPSETATFVFDEVDSGVGGMTAIEIGKRLAQLAKEAQVILVTHLPQIASLGNKHYKVAKTVNQNSVSTTVTELSYNDRILEIARMLSGMEDSDTGKEHAKELLEFAQEFHKLVGIDGYNKFEKSDLNTNLPEETIVVDDFQDNRAEADHGLIEEPTSMIEDQTITSENEMSPEEAKELGLYRIQRFGKQYISPLAVEKENGELVLVITDENGKMIHSTATRSYFFGVYAEDGNIIVSNDEGNEGLVEELYEAGAISEIIRKVGYGNKSESAAYEVRL